MDILVQELRVIQAQAGSVCLVTAGQEHRVIQAYQDLAAMKEPAESADGRDNQALADGQEIADFREYQVSAVSADYQVSAAIAESADIRD